MTNFSIGVDLGGTKILAGLINTDTGEVVSTSKKKTKKELGEDNIVTRIIENIYKSFDKTGVKIDQIKAIGIGAAGQVDRKAGVLISAPNLSLKNIELKDIIEKEFHKPLILGNDVEVATIGEKYFGAGKGFNNFVCVFVGTGVGSGIVHNGNIYHGATGTAGEIGHIILQPNGRLCGCGNHGCMEAYASRTAISKKIIACLSRGDESFLKQFYEEKPDFVIRSKHIKLALDNKDELTTICLLEAADYLSQGLASIINFYNPQKIILGGGLIDAVDFFFDAVNSKIRSKCLPVPSKAILIEKAGLGDYSGIVGAAIMALNKH